MRAKYGYVITTTPGLISEGSWPITKSGIAKGRIEKAYDPHEITVFASRAEAEAVVKTLTPADMSPAVYAGLDVEPAYEYLSCIL